jgi:hypothetical protein
MVRFKICSYCNAEYAGEGKISRRDNKTEICAVCAEFEAFREIFIQNVQRPTETALQTLYQILSGRFGSAKV